MKKTEIHRLIDTLRNCEINWLLVVPSSGLDELYDYYQKQERCVYATREEEAVALATGLALGGEHPILVMQQTGVGNALNAVFTLPDAYQVFFPILVCVRPEEDPNPVQRVSTQKTMLLLEKLDCSHIDWRDLNALEKFRSFVERQSRWIVCPN